MKLSNRFTFTSLIIKWKIYPFFLKKKLDGPDLSSLGQLSIRTGTTLCKRNGEWIEDVQWRAIPASTRVLQAFFFKVRPAGFFVWQVSTTRHSFDGSTVKKASWWRRVQSSFGFIFMFLTPSIIAYIFPHASTASYPPNLTSLTILAPQPPRKTTVNVIFNGDAMPPSCLIVASRLIVFFFFKSFILR